MYTNAIRSWIGTGIWLACWIGWSAASGQAVAVQQPANDVQPKSKVDGADSDIDSRRIRSFFKKLSAAVNDKNIGLAIKGMTREGKIEFMGDTLLIAAEMHERLSKEAQGTPELEEALKVIEKWKLHQVKLPDSYLKADTDEAFIKATGQAYRAVLLAVPADQRVDATMEIREFTTKLLSDLEPFMGEIASLEFDPDRQSAVATIKFSNQSLAELGGAAELGVRDPSELPPIYGRFQKVRQRWRWHGQDVRRTMQAWESYEAQIAKTEREYPIIKDVALSGKTITGQTVRLKDLRGKVVLVDFWGSWCKPCLAELPKLKKIHASLNDKGFEVIGVAADDVVSLATFFSKTALPWDNIADSEGTIADQFNIEFYPTTLLIDQQGRHVASNLKGQALVDQVAKLLELSPEQFQPLAQELSTAEATKP